MVMRLILGPHLRTILSQPVFRALALSLGLHGITLGSLKILDSRSQPHRDSDFSGLYYIWASGGETLGAPKVENC